MLVPDCTLSNPLSYYEVGHRHVPKLVSVEGDSVITLSLSQVIPQPAAPTRSTRVNPCNLLLSPGLQRSL